MGVDRAAAREVVLIFPSAPRLCTRLVTLESTGSSHLNREIGMTQHIAKLTHGGTEFRRGRTVEEPIAGKRHFFGEWIQIDKIAKVFLSDSRIQRGKTFQCDQIESGDYGDLQCFSEIVPRCAQKNSRRKSHGSHRGSGVVEPMPLQTQLLCHFRRDSVNPIWHFAEFAIRVHITKHVNISRESCQQAGDVHGSPAANEQGDRLRPAFIELMAKCGQSRQRLLSCREAHRISRRGRKVPPSS